MINKALKTKRIKQLFSCYLKDIAIIGMLLFATIKTSAQWIELGGANGTPFPYYVEGNYIKTIAIDAAGNVYAGNSFKQNYLYYYYVAKWDGTKWSELDNANDSPFKAPINSIATDEGGNVYAGGDFSDANANSYYVARWNGTALYQPTINWTRFLEQFERSPFLQTFYINSVKSDTLSFEQNSTRICPFYLC